MLTLLTLKFATAIDRIMMLAILRHYGTLEKIFRAIKVVYDNSRSSVFVDGLLTEELKATTGVLRRDVLAVVLISFYYHQRLPDEC